MWSWKTQPSCFISYFLLALRGSLFFFHCTDTPGLDNSQYKEATHPSSASTLLNSFLKNGGSSGRRGEGVKEKNHMLSSISSVVVFEI